MKPSTLYSMLELADDYAASSCERSIRMEMQAAEYAEGFNDAFAERQQQRDADRKQWLNVILPNIQKRAMLAQMQ